MHETGGFCRSQAGRMKKLLMTKQPPAWQRRRAACRRVVSFPLLCHRRRLGSFLRDAGGGCCILTPTIVSIPHLSHKNMSLKNVAFVFLLSTFFLQCTDLQWLCPFLSGTTIFLRRIVRRCSRYRASLKRWRSLTTMPHPSHNGKIISKLWHRARFWLVENTRKIRTIETF